MQHTLDSGAKLVVTIAPFQDAYALQKALLKSAKGLNISNELLSMDASAVFGAVINAATSDEVEACLFKCFERCTYNDVRINKALFDDEKLGPVAREDFYGISLKIIEANCKPFFKTAFSAWSKFRTTPSDTPKQ